ncbi:hypothetical protein J7K05_00615 [bacterium]|nr:hypothetical protein [bacterium]
MAIEAKQEVVKILQEKDNFLISTCESGRISALASILALGQILKQLGKRYILFVPELPNKKIDFLPYYQELKTEIVSENLVVWLAEKKARLRKIVWERKDKRLKLELVPLEGQFTPQDVSFAYSKPDINCLFFVASPRSCAFKEIEKFKEKLVVNLDYHQDNDFFAALNWVDKKSVSMAEMMVALIESLESATKKTIHSPDIATLLYFSLYWATKGLKGKIPAKTFSVAAQLISWGAEKEKVEESFEKRWPADFFSLVARIWQKGNCQNKRFVGSLRIKNKDEVALWEKHQKHILREIRNKTAEIDEVFLVVKNSGQTELWVYSQDDPQKFICLEADWIFKKPPLFRAQLKVPFEKAAEKLSKSLF